MIALDATGLTRGCLPPPTLPQVSLLAGVIMFGLGFLRLGFLTNLMS